MKRILATALLLLACVAGVARAQGITNAPWLQDSSGAETGVAGNPLRVNPTGTTPQPVTQSGSWTILQGGAPWSVSQSGTWTVQQGGAPWSVSQSGTWDIRNITGTISLPTGAATAANQTTANTSLSSIDGKLSTTANGLKVDVQASVLPTGAATSASQATGNASLASIDGKLNSLGQKAMTGSVPVVVASDQSTIPVYMPPPSVATYSASISSLVPPTSATDILTITGSATKKIIVQSVNLSGVQTTASVDPFTLVKRSALNTGGGNGTIVQTANSYTTANTTTATVTVSSTGAGNLLIVGTSNLDNRTVSGVSDGTNAFTQASGSPSSGGGNTKSDIWYLLSSSSGKTTITVTFSGASTTKGLWFWEVSGSGAALDASTHNGASTVGATDLGTAVTSASADIIVAVIGSAGTVTNAPATANTQFTSGGINGSGKSAAVWVQGGSGTYTPSWNDSGSGSFASSSASFTITGSTYPAIPAVAHDSTQSAATASVYNYYAPPTLGTSVGIVRAVKAYVPTTTTAPEYVAWTFPTPYARGIVLNNASESLNLNLGGTSVPGGQLSVDVTWTEQ